ncbi:Bug family tripartite tricarboxylate transporter substrate binding protein [Xylophilus sp. ASV27]|uniref:Bug family tripartite tricarboxylate transporter substrate binding protein n=1 Tax=Xylophilus sp. ASV27 TaxID=2795129 RepID=UPI00351BF30F
MNLARRLFVTTCMLAAGGTAFAQGYPARAVKIMVPFPPGGGTDNLTRLIATKLTETLKWTVVVDNKPGAGGNLALDSTAKAQPDGYTLVMAQTDNVVLNPLLYGKLSYDPAKDLMPVGLVARGPAVLVVRADSPFRTLADVVAAARAKPGQLTFASPGTGTVTHLVIEMWQKSAGIRFTHVPYRGIAQSLPDLIGGQVDMYMGSIPTLQSHIQGGKVRALGVTTPQRSPVLPNVPTYAESGFRGVELASVWGLMAPAGTPPDTVQRLNAEVNRLLLMPDVREKIIASGADVLGGSPQDMARLYAEDSARLAPVIRESGIKLD